MSAPQDIRAMQHDVQKSLDVDPTYAGEDRLEKIMAFQSKFQDMTPGGVVSFKEADPETTVRMIREQVLALTAEAHEAMNECGWKPWATSNHLNVEAFRAELIDVFRFWLNLVHISGLSAEGVYQGYLSSMEKTVKRLIDGYDGVSTKCPACKRAYDDKAVKCIAVLADTVKSETDKAFMTNVRYCQVYGYINRTGDPMTTTGEGDWVLADAA